MQADVRMKDVRKNRDGHVSNVKSIYI